MVLIIGGAYQGKLSWAKERFSLTAADCCDLAAGYEPGKRCYYHLEALTLRGEAVPEALRQAEVLIAREIGSGVVPTDEAQRLWRERHGSLLRGLAAEAEGVVRLFCGLPEVLK